MFAKLLDPGLGLVLPGLSEARHIVPPFAPPPHWSRMAGFDWGFHHPWSFSFGCCDEDGAVYGIETLGGRLQLAHEIDAKVRAAGIDPKRTHIHAGPDIWQARQPGVPNAFRGPTISEELIKLGWRLIPADNARILGLDNMRRYTEVPRDVPNPIPRFRWMDTPGNREALKQWRAMTTDPKRPEDALKVNADSSGRGGDDHYDSGRYMLMSRPITTARPAAEDLPDGVSSGYNYREHKPNGRPSAEDEIETVLMRARPNILAGRYTLPPRR